MENAPRPFNAEPSETPRKDQSLAASIPRQQKSQLAVGQRASAYRPLLGVAHIPVTVLVNRALSNGRILSSLAGS